MDFHGGSGIKNLPAKAGDSNLIPRLGRSPGGGNGNPLQYLAWEIPWTEEFGGLQFMGSQRVRHTHIHTHTPPRSVGSHGISVL